ncbi:glycosyltransferase family 4 protein [Calothrix sp. 336/3]|uniref:glycosyltransferase family 4 protein n=1 Tax=Calothrix sp. 336/3 TaxID=1337936 RepID=UPI000551041A|nr:glycosyltransferase family 4 protein [Calothrix sp. 336/3]AKG22773.1 glycosyl transferase family 1 [Calothrix sp. 336/3]
MRIAYLTGEYPRATDTFIQREVLILRQRGVDVHTFSVRRTGIEHIIGEEQKQERDRTFYLLPPHPGKLLRSHLILLLASPRKYRQSIKLAWSTSQPGLRGALYQFFYFLEAGILAQQIKIRQIQHLHNHIAEASGTVAMLAAEMGGFTYSFTLHGPYIFLRGYQWRLDEKIRRSLFVACISHYARSQGMIFAPMDKWQKMHIIHCGVDPSLFPVVTHKGIGKHLLFIGRLAAAKGLPILLESLVIIKQTHPDVVLTVVGDGSDRQQLQEITAANGLTENVKYVGYKSQTEVREYLQSADVFVMSSFAEGIPVVLMEAMAAGVPVVATQIAGISELVEDGKNGYLVPAGDALSLANRIQTLISAPEIRNKLAIAARSKVEQEFHIHQEVARLHNLFSSALSGKVEAIRPQYFEQPIIDVVSI